MASKEDTSALNSDITPSTTSPSPKLSLLLNDSSLQKLISENPSLPPHQVLRQHLSFTTESSYWWHITALPLSTLMTRAQYPLTTHYRNLLWFHSAILPFFGPIPKPTDGTPGHRPWRPSMLEDGSAFEPSLNLRGDGHGGCHATVRFTIECNHSSSGTSSDPLNEVAVDAMVRRCAELDPGFDLQIYEYMRSQLMILDISEAQRLRETFSDRRDPQMFFAFDFEKPENEGDSGRILGKCVPFLHWKSRQLALTPHSLCLHVIRGIPVIGPSFTRALDTWSTFISQIPAEFGGPPSTECLNFDTLPPSPSSRVKIYVRPAKTSFNTIQHFWTLGGAVKTPESRIALGILRLFYEIMFDIQPGQEDDELAAKHEAWGSALLNYSFTPGATVPEVQFYITVWKYVESDCVANEKLEKFWTRIGWAEQAERYQRDWRETFPWLDGEGKGNTTNISFAYKGMGGVYQSVYYSPMVHVAARKLGYMKLDG
ncbi:aromatic prenyltransferase [Sporormia fimetaria CBS 119925]|uniref:Aromatic prenyltransferase n=1 Tax=Sporormia fimetaria CBS 119925 TaxID=1340428 RepID=A0A6A6VB37_9PLEO|nr:aromatic prenyltransferase [Sporormia fimetaria CBS 119925]